jgi:hypothetical protein
MHRIVETFAKLVKLAALGSLALTALGTAGCYDDFYGDPAYYPPDSYLATEDPIYYEGQAVYFYGGLWYYRNGGAWSYYRSEPAYLRQYRAAHPGYGARGRGARGVVRGGSRGGFRGGGHGGRR